MTTLDLYVPLDDPELLTVQEAKTALVVIRRHLKPLILKELSIFYADTLSDELTRRCDILALELRLQELDSYLSRIFVVLQKKNQDTPDWATRVMCYEKLKTDGETFACCETRLGYDAANDDCIHGPNIMVPVTALAQTLLTSGEWLETLMEVKFMKPVRNELLITIKERARHTETQDNVSLKGVFITSLKRKLFFSAVQKKDCPVVAQIVRNPFSMALLTQSHIDFQHDRKIFKVSLSCSKQWRKLQLKEENLPLVLSSILDTALIGTMNIRRLKIRPQTCYPILLTGFSDVSVPHPVRPLFNEVEALEFKVVRETATKSGLNKASLQFRFTPHQKSFSSINVAETSNIQLILERLHS